MTYTFATLAISRKAWREIADKLRAAKYHHVFLQVRDDDGQMVDAMDMHGIALTTACDDAAPPCRPGPPDAAA